jgi:phosphoribosylformylglycinamidine (FGAM) synthase PurS component
MSKKEINENKLIDVTTGEVMDIDVDNETLEKAYIAIVKQIKPKEEIKEAIAQAIKDRLHDGDKQFGKLTITWQDYASMKFPDKDVEREIKAQISEIQKPFVRYSRGSKINLPKY